MEEPIKEVTREMADNIKSYVEQNHGAKGEIDGKDVEFYNFGRGLVAFLFGNKCHIKTGCYMSSHEIGIPESDGIEISKVYVAKDSFFSKITPDVQAEVNAELEAWSMYKYGRKDMTAEEMGNDINTEEYIEYAKKRTTDET